MPDNRDSFELEARGVLAVGVADQYQTSFTGDALNAQAVIRVGPTGANVTAQLRLDGTVLGTVVFTPGGAVEAPLEFADVVFSAGQTFDLNVTGVGAAGTEGRDLSVSVQYTPR